MIKSEGINASTPSLRAKQTNPESWLLSVLSVFFNFFVVFWIASVVPPSQWRSVSKHKKQCKLSFLSLEPKQCGQLFILSIAWKSTVKSPFAYWSLMISSIPWYLMLVRFPQLLTLKSSSSPSIITFKNHSGWSARFFSPSMLYFSQSFFKTDCPRLLSLHGKIASKSGLWGSMILSYSTCKISPSPKQCGQAPSCLLGEKCWVVNSG